MLKSSTLDHSLAKQIGCEIYTGKGKGIKLHPHQEMGNLLFIPAFFSRKRGLFIPYQSQSVVCLSVCLSTLLSVRMCVCAGVRFLVNVSSPKPLDTHLQV